MAEAVIVVRSWIARAELKLKPWNGFCSSA